jgi:hypothetical protein
MNNRITTPDGTRIILTDATKYKKANGVPGGPEGFYYLEVFNGTTFTNVIFNTAEERDAFLARLDAYFQEIA